MNVLILGSGGREYAMYIKLAESKLIQNLFIAPGNGDLKNKIELNSVSNFNAIQKIIIEKIIDVLIVGPEVPLVEGIKSFFKKEIPSLKVFGPDANSAMLEGSKVFSNQFMIENNIPTASSKIFSSLEESISYIKNRKTSFVIKVDGLAAGKGVSLHHIDKNSSSYEKEINEAEQQLKKIFEDKIFGDAGKQVQIQDFMTGTEASLFAICNGKEAIYLPTARDYKPAFENNEGPNTGGMGSFCPGNLITEEQIDYVNKVITQKVLDKFQYTGILYIGLMLHSNKADDLSVVEFNCRLGDPETQSVMPMLEVDLFPYILWACGDDEILIPKVKVKNYYMVPFRTSYTVNTVIAADGYPHSYKKNLEIKLPPIINNESSNSMHVVHAGTKMDGDNLFSTGGRVLNIVSRNKTLEACRENIYSYIDEFCKINDCGNFHYRKDIAKESSK